MTDAAVRWPSLRAVLFDLDGTLADTAPDLAYALNQTLRHFGRPPLPFEQIRPVVSHGGIALIRLGFGIEPDSDGFEDRRQYLLDVYQQNICRHTRLFDGMADLLAAIEQRGLRWGVVTNKPSWLTDPLMAAMGLDRQAGCIVSGDTCSNNKPHPEPMLHAARLIDTPPEQCLYLGDAERDIAAGRAAGMPTAVALFGYLNEQDRPEQWQADLQISHPRELIERLPR